MNWVRIIHQNFMIPCNGQVSDFFLRQRHICAYEANLTFNLIGKDSFYEELAKVQKIEMDKREKEINKNEMVQVATKKAEEEAKKR